MMVDLDTFFTKVLPLCPGVPEPVAIEHIRVACIEFCEETKLWRYEDSFDLGDDPEFVCVPQGAVIHDIRNVVARRFPLGVIISPTAAAFERSAP